MKLLSAVPAEPLFACACGAAPAQNRGVVDFGPLLPSDLDGNSAPPAGSPNYLMSLDFTADGRGDHLFMWRLSFSKASIAGPLSLPVAPFTIACPTCTVASASSNRRRANGSTPWATA